MKNKFMNLHIFEEGGNGGEGNTAGQNRNSGNGNGSQSGNVGYTFEQAEEIAKNRSQLLLQILRQSRKPSSQMWTQSQENAMRHRKSCRS